MNQVNAYILLNIKILSKDKISYVWSILMPSIFLLLNRRNVIEIQDLRFWWVYIVLNSFIYGIGLHSLILRESGSLKTSFSIHKNSFLFFVANLITQMLYSFVCICIFNIVSFILYGFSFLHLLVYAILSVVILIPVAFLSFNLTLIKKVHPNSLSTLMSIMLILMFSSLSFQSSYYKMNPIYYISKLLILSSWKEIVIYLIISTITIGISIYSILSFSSIPTERR